MGSRAGGPAAALARKVVLRRVGLLVKRRESTADLPPPRLKHTDAYPGKLGRALVYLPPKCRPLEPRFFKAQLQEGWLA